MMYVAFAVLLLSTAVVGDDESKFNINLTPSCEVTNKAIDQHLVDSNADLKDQGLDHFWADYYGFQRDLNLYLWGHKLPFKVSLSVFNATLNNLNTLTRVGDSLDCSTPISRSVEGKFTYGSGLNLTYNYMTAKFLFWEAKGSFTYKPQLIVHTAFFNGSFDCRLESFEVVSSDQNDYIVSTDHSWFGWLVGKLVRLALLQEDTTPLNSVVMKYVQGYIDSSFKEAWCQLYLPDVRN